jgi:hypothetical protein
MKRARSGLWFVFVLALTLCAQTTAAQSPAADHPQLPDAPDEPIANPARPTIANPATLTPVGYLQFETGILGAADSGEFSSRTSLNEVVKLAVASRLMLILGSGEPYVHYEDPFGLRGHAWGDISLGAQALLKHGQGANPALAVNYLYHAHDGGGPDLDLGSPKHSLVLLASADVKGFHGDFNVLVNELTAGNVRRGQIGQTISISHPLKGNISIGGELWRFTQPFSRGNAMGNLWNIGYAARKNLVFDIGFNRGLTGSSTQWEGFAGFTYLIPHKLW